MLGGGVIAVYTAHVVQLAGYPQHDTGLVVEIDERAARADLRDQVARLERQLSELLASAFPFGPLEVSVPGRAGPRVPSLGELEIVRDDLGDRLRAARRTFAGVGERQAQARLLLERMLLEPGHHRFVRLPASELGEGGCGVYHVRPRLGLVGMLAGWWHVKLSSGCPRPVRGRAPQPDSLCHTMGRRSRKRSGDLVAEPRSAPTTPVPAPAAPATLRRKARTSERPPAPWGSAPLAELATFAGLVLFVVGAVTSSIAVIGVAFVLIALPAIELVIREHFAGFRSHSLMIAGLMTAVAVAVGVAIGVAHSLLVAIGVAILGTVFVLMRRLFMRRTGGMGFRA